MTFFIRLRQTKSLFVTVIFMNILFASTGTVCIYHYYKTTSNYQLQKGEFQTQLNLINDATDQLSKIQNQPTLKSLSFDYMHSLKLLAKHSSDPFYAHEFETFSTTPTEDYLKTRSVGFKTYTQSKKNQIMSSFSNKSSKSDQLKKWLIQALAVSLFLGVFIPLMAILVIGKILKAAITELKNEIRLFIKEWKETTKKNAHEQFKWIQLAIVVSFTASKYVKSPLIIGLHDILTIIRQEWITSEYVSQDSNKHTSLSPEDSVA